MSKRLSKVRGLTRTYLLALGIVAILSVLAHGIMAETLRSNEDAAEIINESGRQRMLSQQIALLSNEVIDGKEASRIALIRALEQFSASHARLVAHADAADTATVAQAQLHEAYFGASQTDRLTQDYVEAAQQIAEERSTQTQQQQNAQLIYATREPLLAGLDRVVSIHQSTSEAQTRWLEQVQWAILALVLVVLLLEARFIFRPMAKRQDEYIHKLLEFADRDPLTGLYNRRALTKLAKSQIARSRRHDGQMALLAIDADHFKRVNDHHGHAVGDEALTAIAGELQSMAREGDLVGRIGGEEFVVVLPETSQHEAIKMAERIRQAIAEKSLKVAGHSLTVTASIGVASVHLEDKKPFDTALNAADKMLYAAKDAGRNRVWPKLVPAAEADAGAARVAANR